jgi:hypothetical protein
VSQIMTTAPAVTTPAAPQPRVRTSPVASWFAGTPGRLRALLVLTVAFTVVFGICAAQGFREADGSLNRAEANTAQLVRIQSIHTNLVSANADATNAFLRGGLEPPAQRQHFTDSLNTASRLIAEAAKAQPADSEALGALNSTLLTYQGLIEQARANNRQGLPVGAQYLKDASAGLRTDALPLLTALVTANEQRLDQEFGGTGRGSAWLGWAGALTLLVIAGVMVWLARRTHRYLNLPLLAAGLVVAFTTVVGGGMLSNAASAADDVRDSSYAGTLALSRARIAAYDAKSNESLTLIARGSGAAFEKAWSTSAATAKNELVGAEFHGIGSEGLGELWGSYEETHRRIRTTDDNGDWGQAVELTIGTGGASSNAVFAKFDDASAGSLDQTSATAQSDLRDAGGSLPAMAWLGLPLGLVAALLAWWGFSQRLEEYR